VGNGVRIWLRWSGAREQRPLPGIWVSARWDIDVRLRQSGVERHFAVLPDIKSQSREEHDL
jgi:hypothetical protein